MAQNDRHTDRQTDRRTWRLYDCIGLGANSVKINKSDFGKGSSQLHFKWIQGWSDPCIKKIIFMWRSNLSIETKTIQMLSKFSPDIHCARLCTSCQQSPTFLRVLIPTLFYDPVDNPRTLVAYRFKSRPRSEAHIQI